MADISLTTPSKSRANAAPAGAPRPAPEPYWDLIELLFFAYRDFVSDPDQLLDKLASDAPITASCISSIAIPA